MRALAFLFCVMQMAAFAQTNAPSRKETFGTAMGVFMGQYWKSRSLETNDFDAQAMLKAFQETLTQENPPMTQKQVGDALNLLSVDLRARRIAQRAQLAAQNLKQSTEFLDKHKTEPGVHVLPNGVQYKVLQEGRGPHPKADEFVIVKYEGKLINGKQFDSSDTRNISKVPVSLRTVTGCAEPLQLMSPGAKWEIVVPPAQAYADRGLGGLVPPNAALIYELELVSIQQPPPTPPIGGAPVKLPGGGQVSPEPPQPGAKK